MRPRPLRPATGSCRPCRLALLLALLTVLAAACSDADGGATTRPRDATALSVESLGAEGDTSSTSDGETTTTTTSPTPACRAPQALPRGMTFGPGLVRLHRAATAFAESAAQLAHALEEASDFSPGWGARSRWLRLLPHAVRPVHAGVADRARLCRRRRHLRPETGWVFPQDYALAGLAQPWQAIPAFQAVVLTGFFEMASPAEALAFFESGGICGLVTAFSTAVDQAAAASGA